MRLEVYTCVMNEGIKHINLDPSFGCGAAILPSQFDLDAISEQMRREDLRHARHANAKEKSLHPGRHITQSSTCTMFKRLQGALSHVTVPTEQNVHISRAAVSGVSYAATFTENSRRHALCTKLMHPNSHHGFLRSRKPAALRTVVRGA